MRVENECDAIHAEAQSRGFRAIVEHVAEVASTSPAVYFGARNEHRPVFRGFDGPFERRIETRPARAAIELGF